MSKFILFHKLTAIFKLNINFIFFTNFFFFCLGGVAMVLQHRNFIQKMIRYTLSYAVMDMDLICLRLCPANFCISEMFLPISQNVEKSQTWVTGTDVTQKRNIDLTRFLVQMLSRCVSTKLCLRIFNFYFSNFNYVVNYLIGRCLVTMGRIKNPET